MKWKLSKIFIIVILGFLIFGFKKTDNSSDNNTENFFDIFSPENLNIDSLTTKSKKETIRVFTIYGIINSGNIKKVLIKPTSRSPKMKEKLNKRGYIILNIGDSFRDYQLIKIEKENAIFKNNDKIIKLSVFSQVKNDRIAQSVKNNGPQIISDKKPETNRKNNITNRNKNAKTKQQKNNDFSVKNRNKNKKNTKKKNVKNKNNKKPATSFLELIKKAKKNKGNSNVQNPFLKLFNKK